MAIYYDVTKTLTTVFCTECSSWYGCGFTPEEARDAAGRHEAACHPTVFAVRNQIARHAREKECALPKS